MKRGILFGNSAALCLALACMAAWIGCVPRPGAKTPPATTGKEQYDFKKEGKIPPISERDITKEADIEEIPVTSDDVNFEEVPPQVDSSFVVVQEPPKEPVLEDGFRIQLFASGSSISAEEVKDRVAREFGVPAYVTPVDDMYKVRVGDFTTREAAELFLARCKAAGYKDAWIVTTLVRSKGAD